MDKVVVVVGVPGQILGGGWGCHCLHSSSSFFLTSYPLPTPSNTISPIWGTQMGWAAGCSVCAVVEETRLIIISCIIAFGVTEVVTPSNINLHVASSTVHLKS